MVNAVWFHPVEAGRNSRPGKCNSCGRKRDGTVACWRLRDTSSPPMQSLGVSSNDSCGLRKADGFLQCWGDVRIITSDKGGRVDGRGVHPAVAYKAFSNGASSMCAIKLDDTLDCWGRSTTSVPAEKPSDLGTVKAISVVEPNACAIKSNDSLVCWGGNYSGESDVPNDLGSVKTVETSGSHTCAIKSNDALVCWGDNEEGQIDVPNDLGSVKGIALGGDLGSYFTCAIKADNSVDCWGSDSNGQLRVPSNLKAKQLEAAQYGSFACAIKTDDMAQCWGDAGGIPENPHEVPTDLGTVSEISMGLWHVCVLLKSDQTVRCWGDNEEGQADSPKWP